MNPPSSGGLVSRTLWAVAGAAALLAWTPLHGVLDGVPLDGRFEAVTTGMLVPLLFALHGRVLDRAWARALVMAIALTKLVAITLFTTQGFCTEFRADAPVRGPVATIVMDEPSGVMRSWDVRAHWGSGEPHCSAITRRDYQRRDQFPIWFVNILNNTVPPHHDLSLVMRGTITVGEGGVLAFEIAPAAGATLIVDGEVASASGNRLELPLSAGSHAVELQARLSGTEWRVVPSWNGRSLWSSATVTVVPPGVFDGLPARALSALITTLTFVWLACWIFAAVRAAPIDGRSGALVVLAGAAAGSIALTPLARLAPLAICVVLLAREARHNPSWKTALWLVGVPWMAFVAVVAVPRIGELTLYSPGDDWLTYQVSAYRIFLQGYWLEAGEKLFYYQPLYRWIAGALHIVFGDSSAGEPLWDGIALLLGALCTFVVCRAAVGGAVALVAALLTLALFTLTPVWYLIGRGLAEISAGAFAWIAALLLIRARAAGASVAVAAGVFAVLAFYTRLNHMLFAGALLAFLLPADMPASALRRPMEVLRSVRPRDAAAYIAVLLVGVALLSLRTWAYTGEVNPLAGTSFGLNHTGLSPRTLLSPDVWRNVFHSLFAQMIVNEVFDVRGLIVYAGCLVALLAILQVPGLARVPLAPALALAGALAGALVAHAHGYPGRFSVHLIPLASACLAMALVRPRLTVLKPAIVAFVMVLAASGA